MAGLIKLVAALGLVIDFAKIVVGVIFAVFGVFAVIIRFFWNRIQDFTSGEFFKNVSAKTARYFTNLNTIWGTCFKFFVGVN